MSKSNEDSQIILIASLLVNVILAFIAFGQYRATERATSQAEAIANAERERSSREAQQSRAPMLVVQRCCNQVPISIAPANSPDFLLSRIGLRKLGQLDPKLMRVDEDIRARCDRAFVVRIANMGPGPAISAKAFWEIEKVILADGRILTMKDEEVNGHMKPYLWPATLRSGDTADLLHLPTFLTRDSKLQIKSVSGLLRLSCTDTEQQPYTFSQPFTLDTVYSPDSINDPMGTRLSFHFYEPGALPLIHNVARPRIDAPNLPSKN